MRTAARTSNVITGPESGTHVTQSEAQTWAYGNTVVTTYNDSSTAPSCYSGGSYSTDNGATFQRLATRPFCSGHGTGYGDPVVVYSQADSKWLAVFLASGCGGQGLGVWQSVDGITWTVAPCAHNGGGDDRESGWVDNNAIEPVLRPDVRLLERLRAKPADQDHLVRRRRRDLERAGQRQRPPSSATCRSRPAPTATVFIAGMNEMGGGLGNRQNIIYRSTNGGTTWTNSTHGRGVPGPRSVDLRVLRRHVPVLLAHMGWGDIGAGPNGIIHYAYTSQRPRR